MTLETKRRLVCLIERGVTTRAALLAALPEIDDDDLYYALRTPINDERLLIEHDDVLFLTDAGKDILYRMKEEQNQHFYIVLGAIASAIAAICSLIALFRSP